MGVDAASPHPTTHGLQLVHFPSLTPTATHLPTTACSCHALGVSFEDMAWAELLWVDRLGVYLRAAPQDGGPAHDLRVSFVREVEDEREARSALTMMAQVAWEAQRPYSPQAAPVPPREDAANN